MNHSTFATALFGIVGLLHGAATWAAFPAAVSYQGELRENGVPREGTVDLVFWVIGENGGGWATQIIEVPDVPVVRGLFTASLPLNSAVTSNAQNYKLQIGVREGTLATGPYQFLSPQQPITSVPFALNAQTVDGVSAEELPGTAAMDKSLIVTQVIPLASEPPKALQTLYLVAPASGRVLVRGRGECDFPSAASAPASTDIVVVGVGVDASSALSNWNSHQKMLRPKSGEAWSASFNSEDVFSLAKGESLDIGVFVKRETGNDTVSCRGTFTAEFFPRAL
jgi:hypothetical protein